MDQSAEVHFAQTLASNDKKFRDRALKRLRKYISVRSCHGEGMSHGDFIKIWKGLHYCMWMQDKPLIQEELSAKIVDLLHAFPKLQDALNFVNVFFITEAREWGGIDRLRLDKFMMLIRDILHGTFVLLSRDGWPLSECYNFSQYLTVSVMSEADAKLPYGLKSHIADIYMTEMKKVSLQGINGKKMTILMLPFIYFLLKTKRYELSNIVFGKTVKFVLVQYGRWAWQNNRKKKKKRGHPVSEAKDDINEMEVSEREEENFNDDSDDKEEVERMDIEDEGNKKPKLKFDLSKLLRMMYRLAEDPKIQSRNRNYVYGIVRSYSHQDPNILKRPEIVKTTKKDVKENEDEDDDDVDITTISQFTGEAKEENKKKRKRRRRMKEEDGEQTTIEDANNNNVEDTIEEKVTDHQKSAKKVKLKNKKNMRAKLTTEENEVDQENTAPIKKRKRMSCEGDQCKSESFDNKYKKLKFDDGESAQTTSCSKKVKNKFPTSKNINNSAGEVDFNTNTNALNPMKLKKNSISLSTSPTGFVVYPQINQKRNSSFPSSTMVPKVSLSTSLDRSDSSVKYSVQRVSERMQQQEKTPPSKSKGKAKSKSGKIVEGAGTDDSLNTSGGLMSSLYDVVSTPTNIIMKAASLVVAPVTDPGVAREKTAATPDPCLTPGAPKKVVFDLRRNKANKFKDYLKSLASAPSSPAFEPSKSPSQGILKSPSAMSLMSNSTESLNHKTKGKRKSGSMMTKSPKVAKSKSPKNRKSVSPLAGRKRIQS